MDNNGFIIISEKSEHTGRFFGQIDGTIMDSLVQDRIYKKIPVYDYQGTCTNNRNNFSGRSSQVQYLNPMCENHTSKQIFQHINPFKLLFKWLLKSFTTALTLMESVYGTALTYAQDDGMKSSIKRTNKK